MPIKQKEALKMIKRFKVSILCLVETIVKQENLVKIKAGMIPGWEMIHNYSAHRLGRIWVYWDPGISSIKLRLLTSMSK